MPTNITQDKARTMIQNYRQTAPPNAINCTLFNADFINFLIQNAAGSHISGIRVYMAKDDQGVVTHILAATTTQGNLQVDLVNGYYDFSQACPAMCQLGEI